MHRRYFNALITSVFLHKTEYEGSKPVRWTGFALERGRPDKGAKCCRHSSAQSLPACCTFAKLT